MHDGERRWYNKDVSMHDVDGLNAGFASAILEQYLENPEAVPEEWRELFESGSSELVATHPGPARLIGLVRRPEDGDRPGTAPPRPRWPGPPTPSPVPARR